MIEKISNEEMITNTSENNREARPRWLGHMERKTEGDYSKQNTAVCGNRQIGRPGAKTINVFRACLVRAQLTICAQK